MKNFLSDLLLMTAFCLLAQWVNAQEADLNNHLNESLAVFKVSDSGTFAKFFMPNAELIDASGKTFIGRKAIREWHQQMHRNCAPAKEITSEIISKRTRSIRPDLLVMVATTAVKCQNHSATVAYNCLFRRIDSQWYVETCAIVPVEGSAVETIGLNR